MIFRLLLLGLVLPFGALADIVTVTDGSTYQGTIVRITPAAIFLDGGKSTSILVRTEVTRVVFAKSDLLITATGDTLAGKVFQGEKDSILFGMEGGLRTFGKNEFRETVPLAGGALTLLQISETDGSFRSEPRVTKRVRSPLSASLFGGIHGISYIYPGNRYFQEAAFEKDLSGRLYGLEIGLDVSRRVTASIGLFWSTVSTGIPEGPGVRKPKSVGCSGGFVSALYSFFPDSRFDLRMGIRLALLRGNSSLFDQGAESGELKGGVIPAVEVSYAPAALFRCYVDLGYRSVTLPLDHLGTAVELQGFLLSGGIQITPVYSE